MLSTLRANGLSSGPDRLSRNTNTPGALRSIVVSFCRGAALRLCCTKKLDNKRHRGRLTCSRPSGGEPQSSLQDDLLAGGGSPSPPAASLRHGTCGRCGDAKESPVAATPSQEMMPPDHEKIFRQAWEDPAATRYE